MGYRRCRAFWDLSDGTGGAFDSSVLAETYTLTREVSLGGPVRNYNGCVLQVTIPLARRVTYITSIYRNRHNSGLFFVYPFRMPVGAQPRIVLSWYSSSFSISSFTALSLLSCLKYICYLDRWSSLGGPKGQHERRTLPHGCRHVNRCCRHCPDRQLNYGGKSFLDSIWAV